MPHRRFCTWGRCRCGGRGVRQRQTSRWSSTALSRSSHLISSELHQIKMPGVSKLQWPKNRVEAAYSTTKSAPQTTHMAESFPWMPARHRAHDAALGCRSSGWPVKSVLTMSRRHWRAKALASGTALVRIVVSRLRSSLPTRHGMQLEFSHSLPYTPPSAGQGNCSCSCDVECDWSTV